MKRTPHSTNCKKQGSWEWSWTTFRIHVPLPFHYSFSALFFSGLFLLLFLLSLSLSLYGLLLWIRFHWLIESQTKWKQYPEDPRSNSLETLGRCLQWFQLPPQHFPSACEDYPFARMMLSSKINRISTEFHNKLTQHFLLIAQRCLLFYWVHP